MDLKALVPPTPCSRLPGPWGCMEEGVQEGRGLQGGRWLAVREALHARQCVSRPDPSEPRIPDSLMGCPGSQWAASCAALSQVRGDGLPLHQECPGFCPDVPQALGHEA